MIGLMKANMATAPNHSLLDMSPFAGLPPASITRLVSLFYIGNSLASGAAQLDIIEASLRAGEEPTAVGHKLTQLASACVQACQPHHHSQILSTQSEGTAKCGRTTA